MVKNVLNFIRSLTVIEEQMMALLGLITDTTNALEIVASRLNDRILELEQRTEKLEILGAALMDVTGLEEVKAESVVWH